MKKSRLITAGIIAFSAVSMFGAAAYAADVIDFEDGKYSFASMKTDDGGDPSELSVVDFNGSKQLKVDVTDCANVPKVYFDINSILNKNDFDKVKTIEMDITIESKDGVTPTGWSGGAIGTQGGKAKTPNWAQTPWEIKENDNAVSKPTTIRRKFLLFSERLVNGTPDTHMILMKWSADIDYNMYVDNIRFLDVDGEPLSLIIKSDSPAKEEVSDPAPAETEATTEAVTEAVTEAEDPVIPEETAEEAPEALPAPSEDKPESDNDTSSSTTGNISAFAAASAAVISGYGAAMTVKKKKQKRTFKDL